MAYSKIAKKAKRATEVRACPVCGEEKEFPVRNKTCSRACMGKRSTQRAGLGSPPAKSAAAGLVASAGVDAAHEIQALKDVNRALRNEIAAILAEDRVHRDADSILTQCLRQPLVVPDWTNRVKKKSRRPKGIFCGHGSDTHWGEVVDPREIQWLNAYDNEIQHLRWRNFFVNMVKLGTTYFSGVDIIGAALFLNGDMFSGEIHDELAKTNSGDTHETLLEMIEPTVAGIQMYADAFGKVFITGTVGNHGRKSRKPQAKKKAVSNYDWLFYHLVRRFLEQRGEKRVTWCIAQGADLPFELAGWNFYQTHGDAWRGGSGNAAELSPIMLGAARTQTLAASMRDHFDYLMHGHFHSLSIIRETIFGNSSVKGYDEYAFGKKLPKQAPMQTAWLLDPDDGITLRSPVQVLDKSEPWLKEAAHYQKASVFEGARRV